MLQVVPFMSRFRAVAHRPAASMRKLGAQGQIKFRPSAVDPA
jgi:hypothetical protein